MSTVYERLNDKEINGTVTNIKFINDRLKVDLTILLKERDEIYNDISEYHKLIESIEYIKESNDNKICTQIDLGCNFYMQAETNKDKHIFVDIGLLGFHVEFTFNEAINYIKEKIILQNNKAQIKDDKIYFIQDKISAIQQGISDLLKVSSTQNN